MFKVDFGAFVAAWAPNGYDFRKVRQILHILGGPGFFWRLKTGVSRPVAKTTIYLKFGSSMGTSSFQNSYAVGKGLSEDLLYVEVD